MPLDLERLAAATNRPMVSPLTKKSPVEVLKWAETCQGCSREYAEKDVMVVDDVGPVCLNCCYHLVQEAMVQRDNEQHRARVQAQSAV